MDQLDDSPLKRAPGQSPYGSPQENSAALPDTIDVFSLREDGENGDDSELPFIQKQDATEHARADTGEEAEHDADAAHHDAPSGPISANFLDSSYQATQQALERMQQAEANASESLTQLNTVKASTATEIDAKIAQVNDRLSSHKRAFADPENQQAMDVLNAKRSACQRVIVLLEEVHKIAQEALELGPAYKNARALP